MNDAPNTVPVGTDDGFKYYEGVLWQRQPDFGAMPMRL